MLAVFVVATALVTIAEFGDKTQMLTLVLAARYGAGRVLTGVALAVLALQLIAVAAGALVGSLIPAGVLAWATGLLFIGFGIWTLVGAGSDDEAESEVGQAAGRGSIAAMAAAFFLAELGDKTQIMTMTIAANPSAAVSSIEALGSGFQAPSPGIGTLAAVWLGSTLGMMIVNGAAAVVGHAVGTRLSPRLVQRVSGVVFIGFGVLTAASRFFGG